MKKIIALLSIVAVFTAMLVSPMGAFADYQIIGSPVVDDNTEANEVIFGDNFDRTSDLHTDGHPKDFVASPIASSNHDLKWNRGCKPASTAQYLGTWEYTPKGDSQTDNYFKIETGAEISESSNNHNIYVTIPTDKFTGVGSDNASVYVIECDILPGTSDTVTIEARYTSSITTIRMGGANCTNSANYPHDARFDPYEWHHTVSIIDEINGKYYGFIDGELIREATFNYSQKKDGSMIRISGNLFSNQYCGIDNFVVRKAGNRQLVFDGVLYNDVKNNATYSNKSATISPDARNIFLNKLIINESSEDKEYYIMGATYVNDELDEIIYKQGEATSASYGFAPEVITVKAHSYCHYGKSFENIDPNTEKAKLFIWEKDNNKPVTVSDEFIKSTN